MRAVCAGILAAAALAVAAPAAARAPWRTEGRLHEGLAAYRDVLAGDPGPRRCVYQGLVAAATVELGDKVAA